jgi:serine/threonine protein kinase
VQVHRDIKPENMLFAGEAGDQLKLCDFGSAERFSLLKGPKANAFTDFVSTAWYTAPEVLTHNYRYPSLPPSFIPQRAGSPIPAAALSPVVVMPPTRDQERFGDKRALEAASGTNERGDGGGVPSRSEQCDVWALGVTLHVLLTGPPEPLNSEQCKKDPVWLNMQKGVVRAAPRLPALMRFADAGVHISQCRFPSTGSGCDDCGR